MKRKEMLAFTDQPIEESVENLLNYLSSFNALTDNFYRGILPMLKGTPVEKTLSVGKPGECPQTAYWIDSGYARFYRLEKQKNGSTKDVTFRFFKPGEIMLVSECFFNGAVTDHYAEIYPGSVVVPFMSTSFYQLALVAPEAESLANKILAIDGRESKIRDELTVLKHKYRYEAFIKNFSEAIMLFCDAQDAATYLHMTPEYLSRSRRAKI